MKILTKAIIGLTAAGATYALVQKRKRSETAEKKVEVHGFVRPGFEAVQEAFAKNFAKRRELGGVCSVYHKGEKVVDLWGGVRNKKTGEPREEDTMVIVHSTTKGLAAMTLALAHSRGWIDYDAPVSMYWAEFGQKGKEKISVRQLLANQAGLFAIDEPVYKATVADLDKLAEILARQKPAWKPGTRQAYHAITLGFYESELLRRIDPQHRSLGQFFQDEIATPLGLDFYIRLPESIPDSRLGTLENPGLLEMLFGFPLRFTLTFWNPQSNMSRALVKNPGAGISIDEQHIYARNLEVPSGGGGGTARAIAHAYGVFASVGMELGLSPKTLQELNAQEIPAANGFYDECLLADTHFLLGFMKSSLEFPFGSPGSFGAPGAGGSIGFADPAAQIGYAYVTNRIGTTLGGDPRDTALREALYKSTPVTDLSSAANKFANLSISP